MKRFLKTGILVILMMIAALAIAGCGAKTEAPAPEPTPEPTVTAKYVDGTYFAEMPDFDAQGWKDNVTVTIAGDKITTVVLNATNKDAAVGDKLTAVKNGQYDMVAGGAKQPWDVQAKAIQDYIVANQGTANVTFDAEGKSDAISSATISYNMFFDLVNQALEKAKVK